MKKTLTWMPTYSPTIHVDTYSGTIHVSVFQYSTTKNIFRHPSDLKKYLRNPSWQGFFVLLLMLFWVFVIVGGVFFQGYMKQQVLTRKKKIKEAKSSSTCFCSCDMKKISRRNVFNVLYFPRLCEHEPFSPDMIFASISNR